MNWQKLSNQAEPPLPAYLIDQTKYWFGLFSHQRDTFLWKGMLEIPLTDDTDVAALFGAGGANVAQD